MITPEYCQTMARYAAWQNRQIFDALDGQPLSVLTADRGAFFGSILGTLSHLHWADLIWMSRFDPSVQPPEGGLPESASQFATLGHWSAARYHLDGKMQYWAQSLRRVDLAGALKWYSDAAKREMCRPKAACVAHMFNHQTHHRGQIHAMLGAAGLTEPVSDLFLSPEDI